MICSNPAACKLVTVIGYDSLRNYGIWMKTDKDFAKLKRVTFSNNNTVQQ